MASQKVSTGNTGGVDYIGNALAKHISKSFNVKILDAQAPRQAISNFAEFQVCDIRNFDETKKC